MTVKLGTKMNIDLNPVKKRPQSPELKLHYLRGRGVPGISQEGGFSLHVPLLESPGSPALWSHSPACAILSSYIQMGCLAICPFVYPSGPTSIHSSSHLAIHQSSCPRPSIHLSIPLSIQLIFVQHLLCVGLWGPSDIRLGPALKDWTFVQEDCQGR